MIDKFTNDVPQWVRVRLARRKLLSDVRFQFCSFEVLEVFLEFLLRIAD
jgi:hypothetical protein